MLECLRHFNRMEFVWSCWNRIRFCSFFSLLYRFVLKFGPKTLFIISVTIPNRMETIYKSSNWIKTNEIVNLNLQLIQSQFRKLYSDWWDVKQGKKFYRHFLAWEIKTNFHQKKLSGLTSFYLSLTTYGKNWSKRTNFLLHLIDSYKVSILWILCMKTNKQTENKKQEICSNKCNEMSLPFSQKLYSTSFGQCCL